MASRLATFAKQSFAQSTTEEYIQRLCQSWLLPTWALFGLRSTSSIYAFLVLFYKIGYQISINQGEQVDQSFSYFTVLGYWGLAFYFAFAAAHTFSAWIRGRAWLQDWPNWMKWAHSVFYATVTVYPFIVTAVYWGVLSEAAFDTEFSTFSNISQHVLNSVFAFCEIILPRSSAHPWINVIPLIIVLALYLGLAYLTHDTEGIYVYDFLDPSNGSGSVAGYCIAILAATVIVFVIVRYLQLLRSRLCDRARVSAPSKPLAANSAPRSSDLEMGNVKTPGTQALSLA